MYCQDHVHNQANKVNKVFIIWLTLFKYERSSKQTLLKFKDTTEPKTQK